MNIDKRKVWTAAVAVAIGVGALLILNGLKPHTAAPAIASKSAEVVPQNPAHERAALEEELKRKPGHSPILLRLAEMEREAGRPAGAVPYLRKVLEQESANDEARLELGRVLYEAGDVDGAIRETKQLLTHQPNQVDGLYNLGAIYANLSRTDLAREYWSKAIAADPQSDSGRRAKDGLAKLGN